MTAPDLRELIKNTINTHQIRCPKCSTWMVPCARCTADAVLPVVVEAIAVVLDDRAEVARAAGREHRDIDAVLAWESAAGFVRSRVAGPSSVPAAAIPAPTGTPGTRQPFVECLLPVADGWCVLPIEHDGSCSPTKTRTATSPTGDPA